MVSVPDVLEQNLNTIRSRIEAACRRSGRSPSDVQLVAVTKYAEWTWVQALSEIHSVFGESRPQQLAERQPQLPKMQWHLIGQLQRNKARLALQHADVIHSVDSLRLLQRLHQQTSEPERTIDILLQVNVSGETSKSGFEPAQLHDGWQQITELTGNQLRLAGLMTMAPKADSPDTVRPVFAELRELQQQLSRLPGGEGLTELSMGMSRDFEVAVEEGATLIRVGSSLFDGLPKTSD